MGVRWWWQLLFLFAYEGDTVTRRRKINKQEQDLFCITFTFVERRSRRAREMRGILSN